MKCSITAGIEQACFWQKRKLENESLGKKVIVVIVESLLKICCQFVIFSEDWGYVNDSMKLIVTSGMLPQSWPRAKCERVNRKCRLLS